MATMPKNDTANEQPVLPVEPLGDRIVGIREAAEKQTKSGLILPDTAQEQPVLALVVAVGPKVADIKKGQKIVYKEYASTEITIDKTEYLIVSEDDVLATVKE